MLRLLLGRTIPKMLSTGTDSEDESIYSDGGGFPSNNAREDDGEVTSAAVRKMVPLAYRNEFSSAR